MIVNIICFGIVVLISIYILSILYFQIKICRKRKLPFTFKVFILTLWSFPLLLSMELWDIISWTISDIIRKRCVRQRK